MRGHAGRLSAALLEIEDQIHWDAAAVLEESVALERQAEALGDDLLAARARLGQANMRMRLGDLPGAARGLWKIYHWAVEHDARQLTARTHLVWANLHRHLGDAAQSLEHSVLSVELLDDTSTAHMQIWHRAKLGDALSLAGSMDAARERYGQAADLAIARGKPGLLLALLNNFAYSEWATGDHDRAQQVAAQLREHAARLGVELDPPALDTIGAIEIENGRFAEAERTMRLCLERYGDGRRANADALAEYQLTLARAQRGLGAYDRAQASLDASRAGAAERGLGEVLVRVHQEQAELHAARGEFAEAFAAHKAFFTAYHQLHSRQREAQARTRQAMFETAEARQEAERFREQARRDPLTGLRNRRYVDEQLPAALDKEHTLTVALVDVDHFKPINDQLSHDVGDRVLVQMARLLESSLASVAPDGFVARMGGEEFLLVLPGVPGDRAAGLLDEVRRAVADHDWRTLARHLPVTVSIGAASRTDVPAPTQAALLSIADRNLYAAKHDGRDRVVCRPAAFRNHASAA